MTSLEIEECLRTLRCQIMRRKKAIISILEKAETHKMASSEFEKSISCLLNIDKQSKYLAMPKLSSLSVFLPLNQPLYSLILFVVIPGCRFENTYFRPPTHLTNTYQDLYDVLELSNYNICCEVISRRVFINQRAIASDCVIYTGKYENAIELKNCLPSETIFIFQGGATNPIIISEQVAITDDLIDKIVSAQMYNSGQDCMAPSVIFVPINHWDLFLAKMISKVDSLTVADYRNADADVSSLIEEDTLERIEQLLKTQSVKLLYGGKIDYASQIVYPGIIQYNNIEDLPVESTFAPIISLFSYHSDQEIIEYLSSSRYQERKAYISLFGKFLLRKQDGIIIQDDILDVIDNGYSEFGGFSLHSSFISYEGLVAAKPILISKELSMFVKAGDKVVPVGCIDVPMFEAFIASALIDMSDKTILEIGCGLLPHATLLINQCTNYHAVDINPEIIQIIQKEPLNDSIHVQCLDACNTNYEDKSFSIIFMFHCLHEISLSNQGVLLKEVLRLLDDNGVILLIDTIPDRTTAFQKCFDIVHEEFLNYKHIYGVQHEDWIINEFLERNLFEEIYKNRFRMIYRFTNFEDLSNAIVNSFSFELKWTDKMRNRLDFLLRSKLGDKETYDLEEEICVRLLQKVNHDTHIE